MTHVENEQKTSMKVCYPITNNILIRTIKILNPQNC